MNVADERNQEIAALIEQYADHTMDVADATLIWLAEEAVPTRSLP